MARRVPMARRVLMAPERTARGRTAHGTDTAHPRLEQHESGE
ncbi:hypothetical protein [Streptomyces clavuligerus]|uniref:Uncharacterized protein n=1 Tax=Streptomyces clavuligerus TaxID=1901 RepID=E2Q370_STRCL|nr:hypothetical protein [Streptomyces clavuligerus]EFG08785.1 Hypothetical protein SCLAV_3713 [Streptomyces clavuligerus]